jgi:hypothetical protein
MKFVSIGPGTTVVFTISLIEEVFNDMILQIGAGGTFSIGLIKVGSEGINLSLMLQIVLHGDRFPRHSK